MSYEHQARHLDPALPLPRLLDGLLDHHFQIRSQSFEAHVQAPIVALLPLYHASVRVSPQLGLAMTSQIRGEEAGFGNSFRYRADEGSKRQTRGTSPMHENEERCR